MAGIGSPSPLGRRALGRRALGRRVFALTAALLTVVFLAGARKRGDLRNVKVGDPIPNFSLQGLDGKVLDRSETRGRVLLLVFVRPDQSHSRTALEAVARAVKSRPGAKLLAVAISTKPDAGKILQQLATKLGLRFPVTLDLDRKFYGALGVFVAPTTVLADAQGRLRFVISHAPPDYSHRLHAHLDLLLGKITPAEHENRLRKPEAETDPKQRSTQRRIALARTLLGRRKGSAAVAILTPLHKQQPDSILVSAWLGMAYLQCGKVEKAAEVLDPLGSPKAPVEAALALGRLEVARGNLDRAEQHLQNAVDGSPHKALPLYELGRLHEQRKQPEQAAGCYRRAIEEVLGIRR